jgi:hypothetical protein
MGAMMLDSPDRNDSPLPGVLTPGTVGAMKLDNPDRDDSPLPGVLSPNTCVKVLTGIISVQF